MGIVDAFSPEDRLNVKYSDFYHLTKQATKAEILLNGINCNVPHRFLREMATGESEEGNKNDDE